MVIEHNIKWFLEDPTRLMQMKPFTRGGERNLHSYEYSENKVKSTTLLDTGFCDMDLHPISQDLYITEYRPDLHHIILNKSIPKIKVVLDGNELPFMEITQTASFQKLIHSAHVRNLTTNPLQFTLCETGTDDNMMELFGKIKNEWTWRDREWDKYQAINTCKQLGNVGILYMYDKNKEKYSIKTFSYEDGYQLIPNYDEYGDEIARSIAYQIDGKTFIDTYDTTYHYRTKQTSSGGWDTQYEKHGYPINPLLIKRGKVAWEYAESSIEMWEIMANINAIALKRFGTFALVLIGEMDSQSFKRDSSTLVINLSSDTTNGKQDAKVLNFPEPQTMDGFLKTLEEKISLFSSTTFITPKDITTSNSGGNGIALAMSNDYALATQSSLDWKRFVTEMVRLHQYGLDLETNGTEKFGDLKVAAKIEPWSLETNNTKITNLAMEAPYLSTQTVLEKCPDAAPDEIQRVIKERGELIERSSSNAEKNAQKAHNIAVNRSNEIVDNMTKVVEVEPVNVNS